MSSKRFLLACAAGYVAMIGLVIAVNVYRDVYGIFRHTHGPTLAVWGEERIAKYLHSYRYVPENFDGVLLGSSVSDNLDLHDIDGYHIYNASINGGNIADLLPLADNLFRRGHPKLTVVCVHRYLTNDHENKTDFMTPRLFWGALGSPQLITAYASRFAIHHGIQPRRWNEYGSMTFGQDPNTASVAKDIAQSVQGIQQGTAAVGNYHIDEQALRELGALLDEARRHSDRLVVYYPPVPAPILAARSDVVEEYTNRINALLQPTDVVVDFNRPEYAALRSDYGNFKDSVHLSSTGARALAAELSKVIARPAAEQRVNVSDATFSTAPVSR